MKTEDLSYHSFSASVGGGLSSLTPRLCAVFNVSIIFIPVLIVRLAAE
jgi:hypothetical protein